MFFRRKVRQEVQCFLFAKRCSISSVCPQKTQQSFLFEAFPRTVFAKKCSLLLKQHDHLQVLHFCRTSGVQLQRCLIFLKREIVVAQMQISRLPCKKCSRLAAKQFSCKSCNDISFKAHQSSSIPAKYAACFIA